MPDQELRSEPEMTPKAVITGLFLALVFGAANAYLGMKAGQTIAATIPAAVIAIALFRLPILKGTILEQNITRTAASVGEALVAGAIFTIPRIHHGGERGVRLWSDLRAHYWESALVLVVGGLIGVFFIIVLRRPLVVESGLPFPESVASAEIVKAGQSGSDAPKYIFGAMGFAGLVQILKSDKGLQIFREYSEGFLAFPRSVVHHFNFQKAPIGDVVHTGGIAWTTPNLSPALIGIGYIIGPELSSINVSGGLIAWWLLIPLLLFFDPDLPRRLGAGANPAWDVAAFSVWYNIVRPIAVGTMLVGACSTLFSMRTSIARSLSGAFGASAAAAREKNAGRRTSAIFGPVAGARDGHFAHRHQRHLLSVYRKLESGADRGGGDERGGIPAFRSRRVPRWPGRQLEPAALGTNAFGAGIVRAGDAGHRAKGMSGVAAVLGVASVVACACSVSGSLIQDLKAGHLLGGTPWKMELVEIISVLMLSLFLMLPIIALHEANLATGGIGGRALPAPQAGLMAQLAKGIVGGEMPWGLIGIGAAFGVALTLCGARALMLIAVGHVPALRHVVRDLCRGRAEVDHRPDRCRLQHRTESSRRGEGHAARLRPDCGEAIVGILLAVTCLSGISSFTALITGSDEFAFFPAWGGWLSLLGFAAIAWVLVRIPLSGTAARVSPEPGQPT